MNDDQTLRKCQRWFRIGIALVAVGLAVELSTPFFVSGHFDRMHQLLNEGGIDDIRNDLEGSVSSAARTATTVRLTGLGLFTAGMIIAYRNYSKKQRILSAQRFAIRNREMMRKHAAQHAPPGQASPP